MRCVDRAFGIVSESANTIVDGRVVVPDRLSRKTMGGRLLSINNYFYRRGGAEVVFLEQNRLLAEAQWDVVPFAMRHPSNLPSPWQDYFIEEIEYGRDYNAFEKATRAAKVIYSQEAIEKVRQLVAIAKPDVAHAHNIYHHISPSILPELKRAGIPTVMTVHDLKLGCPSYKMLVDDQVCERCRGGRTYNVVLHRCIKGSLALSGLVMAETFIHRALKLYESVDRFVAPSRFYIDKLSEWGWERERFVHIPNFVDTREFEADHEIGTAFVYAGRLSAEKGIDVLIRAAAIAKQPLVIAGTGPLANELRALSEKVGADTKFVGYLTGAELQDVMRASRAIVLPSIWYENAPVSVMEAYALGRPVIGSAIGGIPELIREGETGFTVGAGNVEAWANELSRVAALPDETIRDMGAAGRTWMEADFSPDMYRDRLISLYGSLRDVTRH